MEIAQSEQQKQKQIIKKKANTQASSGVQVAWVPLLLSLGGSR